MGTNPPHCVTITNHEDLAGGARPWSPGRREEDVDIERAAAAGPDKLWCMSEVDIFCDLDDAEMDAMAQAAPMKSYAAGELVYTPHQPLETLFILKKGRIRIFRVSPDGRALTTAIIDPGTIFGEMVIVGQRMHDSFADALFKSVPERIAGALVALASASSGRPLSRGIQVKLTHEQLAALAATSRETTTKILGELADQGLIALGRGRITVLEQDRLRTLSGT